MDEENEVDTLGNGIVERVVQVRAVAVESWHIGEENLSTVYVVFLQQLAACGGDGRDDGAVFFVVGRRDDVVDGIVGIVGVFILLEELLQFMFRDDAPKFIHNEIKVFGFPALGSRLIDFNLAVFGIGHVGDDGGPYRAFEFVGRTDIAVGKQVDKRGFARLDGSHHQHDERAVLVFK